MRPESHQVSLGRAKLTQLVCTDCKYIPVDTQTHTYIYIYANVYAPFSASWAFAKCLVLVVFPRKGEFGGTDPLGHSLSSFSSKKRLETSIPTFNQDLHTKWVLFAVWSASAARIHKKTAGQSPFPTMCNLYKCFILTHRELVGCRSQERAAKCGRGGFRCTKAEND